MNEGERPLTSAIATSRNLIVAALLGGGAGVMGWELAHESVVGLGGAVAVGVVMILLLPRPLDLRALVYAFFVPISMTYGAITGRTAILVVGAVAGVFFLLEKTVFERGRPDDGGSP
ncbi:MAG: hypothetical protein QOD06_400 [Candidatus Binatota bacterium]|jgi:hypothetical protein|nr:hypothetical protein [Candidatus Binatota bacterium]